MVSFDIVFPKNQGLTTVPDEKASLSDVSEERYWSIYTEIVQSLIQTAPRVRAGEELSPHIASCVNSGQKISGVFRNFRVHFEILKPRAL